MSRIYMNSYDDWGCGFYRAKLPVFQCYSDLSKHGINLHLEKELHSDELFYDAYILHRLPFENSIFFVQSAQKKGAKFVLELDDDILNIPEWMPSEEFKSSKWALKKALEMADEVWVSTQPLADEIKKPEKTRILPNLVDFNSFLKPTPPLTNPIRILWMGSMWHEKDLEQLVEPTLRIIEEYGDKVQFLFWGCLPTAFADFHRIPGQNLAILTQKNYGNRILFLEGIQFKFYFDRLVKVAPYIGLAPLYDCVFNDSKSNLKFLEYTMAGAATIATNLLPYQCIENGVDGLLVEPYDSEGWYKAIKLLIDDHQYRDSLVNKAKEKIYTQYSWQSQGKKNIWLDAFRQLV
jgi:glycosyltransferase involved in cell wall biosynthesis